MVQTSHIVYRSIFVFLFLCISLLSFAQQDKETRIIIAEPAPDLLRIVEVNGETLYKLVGKVHLQQGEMHMYCDSALNNKDKNLIQAFGNVHINQADTVKIWGDSLFYDGNTEIAEVYGDVRLEKEDLKMTTNKLTYDAGEEVAYYFDGAVIQNQGSRITSERGYYYTATDDMYYRKDVVVEDSSYTLYADTLKYNARTEITTFYGPTDILYDTTSIYCERGWYDTRNEEANFGRNTTIYNDPQVIKADSLHYWRLEGRGDAFKKFVFIDTTQDVTILGTRAEYYENSSYIHAMNRPLLIYRIEDDTLFLSADTLKSVKADTQAYRYFKAYYDVRLYKSDLQGICDSLFYSFEDSIFRMYYDPVTWSDSSQMTADTITIHLKNEKIDRIYLLQRAFIASRSASVLYDQIKAKKITGYFEEDELKRMYAVGNCQSLYFGKDSDDAFVGANFAESARLWMYFRENSIHKIKFMDDPVATFTPMKSMTKSQLELENFEWREAERPMSRDDLGARF